MQDQSSEPMKILFTIFLLIMATEMYSQSLPYYEIPPAPDEYTSGNVMGRLIDGLGFRYYWATEGLLEEDLKYKPSDAGRTMDETLEHIYGLSLTIVNAPQNIPNESADQSKMTFLERREHTLKNFEKASTLLKTGGPEDIDNYKIIFKRGVNQSEFPFWNLINGPITDAIWHTGQVVLLRRAAGNPINPKVSVFTGTIRE